MIIRKLSLCALIVTTMLLASNLSALGLGSLEVNSGLNEELDGTIKLSISPSENVGSVKASIASPEEFAELNVDYDNYISSLRLGIEELEDGDYILRIRSSGTVMTDPYIHFLIRIDYSGGSFLREYTGLIESPVYSTEAAEQLTEPELIANGTDESLDQITEELVDEVDQTVTDELFSEQEADDEQNQGSENSVNNAVEQYGPIATGESLSQIAAQLQSQFPDLSIYQIMKVLFEQNRHAFINNNINGLMKGALLNLSDLNAIRQVDIAEAKKFFAEHVNDWAPSQLASSSAETELRVGQDEYVDATSQDNPATSNDNGVGAFQVGSSSDTQAAVSSGNGSQDGEVAALRQQVSELESTIASKNLENKELTERVSLLEGQLADMNRLMEMSVEDSEMAAVQSSLSASAKNDEPASLQSEVDSPANSQSDAAKQRERESLIWKLMVGGGALLLAALGFLFFRGRRQRNTDEEGLNTSNVAERMNVSESIESSQQAALEVEAEAEDNHEEIDHEAQAEIHLAYGRDDEAEAELIQAIEESPDNIDAKITLLELYHKSDNVDEFEKLSGSMSEDEVDNESWERIQLMGRELTTDNQNLLNEVEIEVEDLDGRVEDEELIGSNTPLVEQESVSDDDDLGESEIQVAIDDREADRDESIEISLETEEYEETVGEAKSVDDHADGAKLDAEGSAEKRYLSNNKEMQGAPLGSDFSHPDDIGSYDEARTQYELAKVFVDLGDEEGAQKILFDIVESKKANEEVLELTANLLDSINK